MRFRESFGERQQPRVHVLPSRPREGRVSKQTTNPPAFAVYAEGAPRDLHPILRDEFCRIASEVLRNAFRHAQARRIKAEIRYDEHRLQVQIRDDGRGTNEQVLTDRGSKGHRGLRGMHERAKLVGGKLAVWSTLHSGTEIDLTIPASSALCVVRNPGDSEVLEKRERRGRDSFRRQRQDPGVHYARKEVNDG